jgi:hypothetical protein
LWGRAEARAAADLREALGDRAEEAPATPSREFVEKKILAPGALDGMNLDARVALIRCIETGVGAEEVTSFRKATIHLKAKVPYVSIVSREGAMQKNSEYRPRDIPLVGIALDAMKLRPAGIERYHDKNTALSAAENEYLDDRGALGERETHPLLIPAQLPGSAHGGRGAGSHPG